MLFSLDNEFQIFSSLGICSGKNPAFSIFSSMVGMGCPCQEAQEAPPSPPEIAPRPGAVCWIQLGESRD